MDTSADTTYAKSRSDSEHQLYDVYESPGFTFYLPPNIVWSDSLVKILSSSQNAGRIKIHKIPFGEKTLIRRESISLPVTKSDCGNYFMIKSEDLGMQLSEEALEDLEDVFQFMLRMTWEDYVMDDRENLTEDALKIRDHLEATYRCV